MARVLQALRRFNWSLFGKMFRVFALSIFILIFFQSSTPPPGDLYVGVGIHARGSLFNYVGWEVDAVVNKLFEQVFGVSAYLDEETRSDIVRTYMADLGRLFALSAEVEEVYVNPAVNDPDEATAELRVERDALRCDLRDRRGMVENILEEQISTVLVDEGLGWLGQVLPPVALHFTPLPDVLIISPRDEIRVMASVSLDDMPVEAQSALETVVDADFDVSSLVVPIGGMALYPSMVQETDYLAWAIETSAHEWFHHYLFFYPLGFNYFDDSNPDTRAINETTADLLGKEVGAEVLRRYYPELAPPTPEAQEPGPTPTPAPTPTPDPDAFDYFAEMHETRVTVDDLLAEGRIEEAEAYMEARHGFFHENGYVFRRINQAFFAFYGGYQADPADAAFAGEDPIGPAMRALREQSASLAEFLAVVRNITTTEELLATLETMGEE